MIAVAAAVPALVADTTYFVVCVIGVGGTKMFINNVEQTSTNPNTNCFDGIGQGTFRLGEYGGGGYVGAMLFDELQYSTQRSVAWVGASYYAQSLELVYEGYHTGVEYARRGEVVAAALIASVILIPLLIIGIFAAKRKW